MRRADALRLLKELAERAWERLQAGDECAFNLSAVRRVGFIEEQDQGIWSADRVEFAAESMRSVKKVTQLWALMDLIRQGLAADQKQTQRELWYKLKPTGLFCSAAEVYGRILDVCAVLTEYSGELCPREALGVIAGPKGLVSGSVSVRVGDAVIELDHAVQALPGDPEECCKIEFIESRARYILVVEKDTMLNRLVADGFVHRIPSLVVTARGFPDLATRAFVQHAVATLNLPCFAFTDHNPHGLALMLTYKHGSVQFALERYRCPELVWIGLKFQDMQSLQSEYEASRETILSRADDGQPFEDAMQQFTARDVAVLQGILQRPEVQNGAADIFDEAQRMQASQHKMDVEALHILGPNRLVDFLVDKIMPRS